MVIEAFLICALLAGCAEKRTAESYGYSFKNQKGFVGDTSDGVLIYPPDALSAPAFNFTRPPLMASSEREQLIDWLRKNNPEADVFISPKVDEGKLKEQGWERVPFRWKDNEIWIQRKPPDVDMKKKHRARLLNSAA